MKITHISARNIKGFAGDFSLNCGDVVIASGSNGTNKTSLLSLVTGLFGKANARMLRAGASEGEIKAILEDDGEQWEITRKFEPDGVKPVKAKSTKTGSLGAPARWLKEIIDLASVDPINEMMNASEERQAEILLETMKLDLDEADLLAAVADAVEAVPSLKDSVAKARKLPALDALKLVEDAVYEKRTDFNREAKTKRIHAEELLASVEEPASGDDSMTKLSADEIQEEITRKIKAEAEDKAEAEQAYVYAVRTEESEAETKKAEINASIDEQIKNLEVERHKKITEIQEALGRNLGLLAAAHQDNLRSIDHQYRPEQEALAASAALAKKSSEREVQSKRTREIAAKASAEAEALELTSKTLTGSLASIDEIRQKMLSNLPLKGLKVENRVPYLDGIPLSEVNTQKRSMFWVKVAAMRSGDLGIVCMDGTECLDPEHFEFLVEAAKKTGLQWFFGRVTGEEFKIETYPAGE